MPTDRSGDRHASPRRAYQLPDEEWSEFDEKADAVGSTRSRIATELVQWWLGRRAEPPARPE